MQEVSAQARLGNAMSGPWKRDLEADLFGILFKGYEVVVSLHEFVELEVDEMRKGAVENAEMKWIWVSIVDGDVPTQANDDGLNRWSIHCFPLFLSTAKVV